jgi:hypothetical protein
VLTSYADKNKSSVDLHIYWGLKITIISQTRKLCNSFLESVSYEQKGVGGGVTSIILLDKFVMLPLLFPSFLFFLLQEGVYKKLWLLTFALPLPQCWNLICCLLTTSLCGSTNRERKNTGWGQPRIETWGKYVGLRGRKLLWAGESSIENGLHCVLKVSK